MNRKKVKLSTVCDRVIENILNKNPKSKEKTGEQNNMALEQDNVDTIGSATQKDGSDSSGHPTAILKNKNIFANVEELARSHLSSN